MSVIVWGASGHAAIVADILHLAGVYHLAGFLDDQSPERWQSEFCGATILGGREVLPSLHAAGHRLGVVAVGDNRSRRRLADLLASHGFELVSAVHPRAVVAAGVEIGKGTVVAAGAILNVRSRIGDNVIVNTAATVDHDCRVANDVHLSPGVHLAGGVTIGEGTWLGIGAVVSDHVTIGPHSVVGAGAVVLHDLPAHIVAYGVPARVQRNRDPNNSKA